MRLCPLTRAQADEAFEIPLQLVRAAADQAGLPEAASGRGIARHLSACVANADLPEEERQLGEALREQGWTGTTHVANDTFAVLRAGLDGPGEVDPLDVVLFADPGRARASAPAVTTLATVTVVVADRTLARPRSLAATAWRIPSFRRALLISLILRSRTRKSLHEPSGRAMSPAGS